MLCKVSNKIDKEDWGCYVRFQIKLIKKRGDEPLLRKSGNRFRKMDEKKIWFSGTKDGQYRGLIYQTTGPPKLRDLQLYDGTEETRFLLTYS